MPKNILKIIWDLWKIPLYLNYHLNQKIMKTEKIIFRANDLRNHINKIESEGKKKDAEFFGNLFAGLLIGVYLYYLGTVINIF